MKTVCKPAHADRVGTPSQCTDCPLLVVAPDVMAEARAWVDDCQWGEGEAMGSEAGLSDATIRRGIDRHYAGGWAGFVASCG